MTDNASPQRQELDRPSEAATKPNPGLWIPNAWADRLTQVREQAGPATNLDGAATVIPRSATHYAGEVNFVETHGDAQTLVELARQLSPSCVGIDFEYRYNRPGILVKTIRGKDHYWYDPRSLVPLLLSIALVEQQRDGTRRVIRFVVDCSQSETVSPLAGLFAIPVPFVAHFAQAELFCLWALGLPVPDQVWDTCVAERAFLLGVHHSRYDTKSSENEGQMAEAREAAEEKRESSCGLAMTCLRRGVAHLFAEEKDRLQRSFLSHSEGQPFDRLQIEYSAADAVAATELYPRQIQVAIGQGCLRHLVEIEMPWTITNARIAWDGVRVCPQRCTQILDACRKHQVRLTDDLREKGLDNVNSHPQLRKFFDLAGLRDAFRVRGKYSFSDQQLEAAEDRHPAIPLIRHARKVARLLSDKSFTGELVGADGRLHPEHRQFGAESGRNSMRYPNIGGIGKALRPVVIADEGCRIGEVDLSQIEVGIAAAVYGDLDLIEMFNDRDVYTAMAKRYYAADLTPETIGMSDRQFKKQHSQLRARMKVFTLATIYNITAHGLALRLGCTTMRATEEQAKFLAMFPKLSRALEEAVGSGILRGYAYICSGLRRWRAHSGCPTGWEVNWMRNTPVQGSAGVVFKVAGNRLYRRYQHLGARLILPMHDAFVFEAPLSRLKATAKVTAEVMRSVVQEYFPALNPQVDINIDHPSCWNKDGKWRSLDLWLIHPEHARRYL